MSNKGNKYKVGVFVVFSLAVLVIGLISLGIMKYIRPRCEFMTVVTSSVQGLEKGAKVKFKGVTIGQVTDIDIGPKGGMIYIYMEFFPDSVTLPVTGAMDISAHDDNEKIFRKFLHERVEEGLRCKLNYDGITGSLYQELAMYDPKEYPVKKYPLPHNPPPYLPSIPPVLVGNILDSLNTSLQKLAKVDVDLLVKKIDRLLDAGNNVLRSENIENTIKDINALTKNLRELSDDLRSNLSKEKVKEFIDSTDTAIKNINKSMESIDKLANQANKVIVDADIEGTTKTARKFMSDTGESISKTRQELRNSLEDFNRAMRTAEKAMNSARNLLDYLEKNPSSLIHGKDDKSVISP